MELLLPKVRAPVPKRPSYEVLDMAFGVGAGAQLFDKSRYRSHGAITTATWVAGLHGYCLDFVAATPDYVEIPAAHTQLNFIAEDFSIVTRLNADAFPDDLTIFIRGLFKTDGYRFFLNAAGSVYFQTHQALATQSSHTAAGAIVVGTWYTLGVSRNGASVRIYRNGVDIITVAGVHINPLLSLRSAKIGVYDDLARFGFDGRIEFCRIFRNIALTASEHLAWHRALA